MSYPTSQSCGCDPYRGMVCWAHAQGRQPSPAGDGAQETPRKKCIECDAPVTDGSFDLCQKCEDAFHAAEEQSTKPPALPPERAALVERLEFLSDLFNTRMVTARSADDSARPSFEVDMPTRELDAAMSAMREAAAALRGETGANE